MQKGPSGPQGRSGLRGRAGKTPGHGGVREALAGVGGIPGAAVELEGQSHPSRAPAVAGSAACVVRCCLLPCPAPHRTAPHRTLTPPHLLLEGDCALDFPVPFAYCPALCTRGSLDLEGGNGTCLSPLSFLVVQLARCSQSKLPNVNRGLIPYPCLSVVGRHSLSCLEPWMDSSLFW